MQNLHLTEQQTFNILFSQRVDILYLLLFSGILFFFTEKRRVGGVREQVNNGDCALWIPHTEKDNQNKKTTVE